MINHIFEKIVIYLIGGISGFIIWIITNNLPKEILEKNHNLIISILSVIIGALVASNIQEYKKEKQVKKNNQIRNETVALITHEMRTALTSTGWAIQSILNNYQNFLKEEDRKMLDDLVKSTHTTTMHTVNLLDVSLLDIGKLAIALEWVDIDKIKEMIKETIGKYRLGAEKEDIKLIDETVLPKEKNIKVEVDILRLRIVIENLLENAFQYINLSKNKEIKVETRSDGKNLNIIVSDTGIGIPEKEQVNIFKEFFRASNARKKLSSGSGIGLYMCKQYIVSHKGTIRFESKEGVGTKFFITIPLKTSGDTEDFLRKI